MSSETNKHGLTRSIPEDVKREVRQQSGFGCVICGLALYQYEHVDPEFADAEAHNPNCICLLCPNHHARVTKGLLSKEDIKNAMRSPSALRSGFSHDNEFSILKRPLKILLGQVEFTDPSVVLQQANEPLVWVEEDEGRLLLNAKFYDQNGRLILEIINNEWRHSLGNWDVEQVGKKIKIRESSGQISLTVNCISDKELRFDYLNMFVNGHRFKSRRGQPINIETSSGAGFFDNQELRTKGPLVFREDGGFEITSPLMIRGGQLRGSRI